MKKTLLFIATLIIAANVEAQEQGKWFTRNINGDELKGTTTITQHLYVQKNQDTFVFWNDNEPMFMLYSDKAIFNTHVSGYYIGLNVLIGIYDGSGMLKDKFDLWLDLDDSSGHQIVRTRSAKGMSGIIGQKKKLKKLTDALHALDGYVRIICSRYNAEEFDMIIPPITE